MVDCAGVARELFPEAARRRETVIECCRAVLSFLYDRPADVRPLLACLTDLSCFPDTANGVGRPGKSAPRTGHPRGAVTACGRMWMK